MLEFAKRFSEFSEHIKLVFIKVVFHRYSDLTENIEFLTSIKQLFSFSICILLLKMLKLKMEILQ